MLRKIKEIKKALKLKLYESALVLTLVLPDICASAVYGETNRTNYIKWLKEYIPFFQHKDSDVFYQIEHDKLSAFGRINNGKDIDNTKNLIQLPQFTAEMTYYLRCTILHLGSERFIDFSDTFQKNEKNNTYFNYLKNIRLGVTKTKKYKKYGPLYTIADRHGNITYFIDIERLCNLICEEAKKFYQTNKQICKKYNLTINNFDSLSERNYLVDKHDT